MTTRNAHEGVGWRGALTSRRIDDHDAIEWWRVAPEDAATVADRAFDEQVRTPAGVHLSVVTSASALEFDVWIEKAASSLDVLVDGVLSSTGRGSS